MIPLRLETLLDGRVVEQDRVEYKRGWNPLDVIHTICAFANDFHNMNGGYIVIGIGEENGQPALPPVGIESGCLDSIQKELFEYCNLLEPRYIPKLEILNYQEKYVIYLECSAGQNGPYKAPVDVYGRDRSKKEYYIKIFSIKTVARGPQLFELFEKFNSIPFDDRVSRDASIKDINRGYVEEFLRASESSLTESFASRSLEELASALEVANITDTGVRIRNIGILMFHEHPEKFFPGAQIELIRFYTEEGEASDEFTEKIFTGPIFKQVVNVLEYMKTTLIEEKVVKVAGKAEAVRYFNYPYAAVKELVVNAVFHKSYLQQEPVEIRVYIDCIKILNYPGPELSIDMDEFRKGKVIARRYRNRRIGEFFKELSLSEKHSTGISKVLRVLQRNGSRPPEFETNERRDYLITTLYKHEGFHNGMKEDGKEELSVIKRHLHSYMGTQMIEKVSPALETLLMGEEITNRELCELLDIKASAGKKYFEKLREAGLVIPVGGNRNRRYVFNKCWHEL